jgi:hypothetical protein
VRARARADGAEAEAERDGVAARVQAVAEHVLHLRRKRSSNISSAEAKVAHARGGARRTMARVCG